MKKAIVVTLVLGLLISAGVFGAAQKEEGAEQKDIVIWLDSSWGARAQEGWRVDIAGVYMKQNPNVNVEVANQANIYDTTRTALAGGGGPDLVMTYGPFALELGKAGFLYPLDEYIASYDWGDHFAPWSLLLYEVSGSTYALPDEIETLVLYYNKSLFDEQGWTAPNTTAELLATCKKADAAGIVPFSHANAEWRGTNEWFVGEFINCYAGVQKTYEALKGTRSWTDPDFVEAMQILTDIVQNGWFLGGLDRYYTFTGDQRLSMFGSGEAAMDIEGTWQIGGFGNYFGSAAGNNNEWSWVATPSRNGESIFNVGIGNALAVNKNTKHPDEVARMLDFFYSSETQGRLFTGDYGKAPAPVKMEEKYLEGANPKYVEILLEMNKAFAANNYGYTTWTFFGPKTNNYIIEEVEKLWADDISVKQYMEGWQKLHAQELAAGEVPPVPSR